MQCKAYVTQIRELVEGLGCLDSIQNLRIDFEEPEEEFYLLEKLNNLTALNDVKIVKYDVKKGAARKTTKSSKKGEKIGGLTIKLTSKGQQKDGPGSSLAADNNVKSYESIYSYVKEILATLGVKGISANELREFIRTLELDLNESRKGKVADFMDVALKNMAVFSVHNFCYTRALDLLKETDTRFFAIFKGMHELLNGYIRSFFESVLDLDGVVAKAKTDSQAVEREAIDHTADLLGRAEQLYAENEQLQADLARKKAEWESEKKHLLKNIKESEKANSELIERMVRITKGSCRLLRKSC